MAAKISAILPAAVAALFVLIAIGAPAALGPGCVATPGEFNAWGEPGQNSVYGDVVPSGERWLVRAASINSEEPVGAQYMLEIAHPVAADSGVCCWFTAVQRGVGEPDGTPQLALEREVTLLPGERLFARANGLHAPNAMALTMLYWRLPLACPSPASFTNSYQRKSGRVAPRDLR
ncbi:MAG TPA: hypothetical protein VKE96_25010 [Vicinamibacterales bacterium]|nr:hypothetical protein [Vicinamibacterales bacterium]